MKGHYELKIEDLDYEAEVKCCSCGSRVRLTYIREEYEHGYRWNKINKSGSLICGSCSHELFEECEPPKDLESHITSYACVKCGRTILIY